MAVAFPASYNLSRSTRITDDLNTTSDIMDDGTEHVRVLGAKDYSVIDARLEYLTASQMTTIVSFLKTNRAEEITWTIDGIDYIGRVVGNVGRSMVGNLYNVDFRYRARVDA